MVKEYRAVPLHVLSSRHHQSPNPYEPVARYIDFLAKLRQKRLKDRRDAANLNRRFAKLKMPKNPKHFDIVP